jgi:hypothetical protein
VTTPCAHQRNITYHPDGSACSDCGADPGWTDPRGGTVTTPERQSTEYGVRHPDGGVERIRADEANEAYMSAAEYATLRAKHVGGEVVTRIRAVTITDWTPVLVEEAP